MSTSEIMAILAVVISAVSLLMGGRRNTQTDAVAQGRLEGKVDGVARGVEYIRTDIRDLKAEIGTHTAKLAELESSTTSAHHRLDEIFALYRKAHPADTK
jgi:outer membrane murein-binding lipoprotein Lpp